MIKVSIPNIRNIKQAILKGIEKTIPDNPKSITIGIHEDVGTHANSNMTVAKIGAINHFGADNIPARPWLDVGVASGKKEYTRIIRNVVGNGGSLDDALDIVAPVAQAATQQYIIKLKTPANAPSTIKRKNSTNPLIDTGQMSQSVKAKIVNKPIKGGADAVLYA